jgi:hypothetical protein
VPPRAETEEQATARRAGERAEQAQRRAAAVAFNAELGVAMLKAFAKTTLDARVLRVLTAVDFKDDLDALAARGARYGFPGWSSETSTPGGKPKTVYPERHQAGAKAHEFLAGAGSAQEIAGCCLALVVMAALAVETCVAQSSRSLVSLSDYQPSAYASEASARRGLPWRRDVLALVEQLALERLPEHLTQQLRHYAPAGTQATDATANAIGAEPAADAPAAAPVGDSDEPAATAA